MRDETLVNHQPQIKLKATNKPLVAPIYQSVKYTYDSLSDMEKAFFSEEGDFVYARMGNPTTRQLEILLAQIQGCEDGVVFGSGIGAITSILTTLVQSGDHLVMFLESYRPTRAFVTATLKKFGVTSTIVSVEDQQGLEKAFIPGKTKAVIFESPTNPVLKIADIENICALAKKYSALAILDNTFAGFQNHHDLPIDLYVHSLTKFAVGHGDAMGGAVLGSKKLIQKIRTESVLFGATLSPESATLVARGLKTYYLRTQRQRENAAGIAGFLAKHKKVKNLSYPGLSNHPQHALAKKQMKDFGSLIAFDVDGDSKNLHHFIDALKIFKLAASLGSTESLVAPCELFFSRNLSEAEKKVARIHPTTVRLSIGIESLEDLVEDLAQALDQSSS